MNNPDSESAPPQWRYYKIATPHNRGVFYAPNLDNAVLQARARWPGGPWSCEGSTIEPPVGAP